MKILQILTLYPRPDRARVYGLIAKKGQAPKRIEYQITGNLFTPIERRVNAIKQLCFLLLRLMILMTV